MVRKPLLAMILVLALATMACGFNINIPVTRIKTGPDESMNIQVPALSDKTATADVTLSFGAGQFTLAPGAEGALVSGTATYNVPEFKPTIDTSGNSVKIEQGDMNIHGIPSVQGNVKNTWDLKLASSPMNLKVNAGAYEGHYELGGLALESLEVNDGASTTDLAFSHPNQTEMSSFQYSTGASNVTLTGLANANFSSMTFRSGAGTYELNFSGTLQKNTHVSIESGVSTITVVIPKGVPAQVTFSGSLSSVTTSGAWQKNGDTYSQEGTGPTIHITVEMGAGTLKLSN